jgi:hypothetical protein
MSRNSREGVRGEWQSEEGHDSITEYNEHDEPVNDVQSVYASEVGQFNVQEAQAVQDSAWVSQGQPFATEQHHVCAQEFRSEFEQLGLNIDQCTVDVDRDNHQGVLHARDQEGSRNSEWASMFAHAEETGQPVTREAALEQAQSMIDANSWNDSGMHAYNDQSGLTTVSDLIANDTDSATTTATEPVAEAPSANTEASAATSAEASSSSADAASDATGSTSDADGE